MTRYAAQTTVSVDRSRAEIEHLLERFGASSFISGWDKAQGVASLAFELHGRRFRFRLELPDPDAPEFVYKKINQSDYREKRTPAQQRAAWEQVCKERWRALALLIKAKVAAVDAGITTVEEEFLPSVLLPDQRTVSEWLQPQVARLYETGTLPPLLPLPKGDEE